MPKVRVGGIELYYEVAGQGEPVVLIMGFGGDHQAWGFQYRELAGRYRVVAFDNRGAGQSDAPDLPYTTRMMAEDTIGLMDALGIDRAHVVGASMGGMIAQELALAHPARVRSLQLHCTLAQPDAQSRALIQAWRGARPALTREQYLRLQFLWLFSPATWQDRPDFIEMILANGVANPFLQSDVGFIRQGDAILTHDALDRLPSLRAPTLVTVGEDDILVPPRFSRGLAAAIRGAELHTVPGAGHVHFWEQVETFNRLCLTFLARHRGG
jgi:pimeloyl-ACP methyl ester carboxylesterase